MTQVEVKQSGLSADKSDAQWLSELGPERFAVMRRAATEAPFSGDYVYTDEEGVYHCAACSTPLFHSSTKFDAHCGWPSFTDPVARDAVELEADHSLGMSRVEVRCASCHSHLGHVFPDGPGTSGDRFCINSVAIKLEE